MVGLFVANVPIDFDIAIRSRGLNVNEKREEREVEDAMLLMSTSVQRGNLLVLRTNSNDFNPCYFLS